jgi:hypothetical protein
MPVSTRGVGELVLEVINLAASERFYTPRKPSSRQVGTFA